MPSFSDVVCNSVLFSHSPSNCRSIFTNTWQWWSLFPSVLSMFPKSLEEDKLYYFLEQRLRMLPSKVGTLVAHITWVLLASSNPPTPLAWLVVEIRKYEAISKMWHFTREGTPPSRTKSPLSHWSRSFLGLVGLFLDASKSVFASFIIFNYLIKKHVSEILFRQVFQPVR